MSIYSVLYKGKAEVFHGNYADLLTDGKIYSTKQLIVVDDRPGEFYIGDGVNTFSGLKPVSGSIKRPIATALNTTAAATSAAMLVAIKAGLITSTSAAAVTLTLPLATALATAFGGARGVSLEFVVDNTAGASTVTVAVATGITVLTAVITGSDTLTVAAGTLGVFKLIFTSATTAKLTRLS